MRRRSRRVGVETGLVAAALLGAGVGLAAAQGAGGQACRPEYERAASSGTPESRREFGECLARLGEQALRGNQIDRALDFYQQALRAYTGAPTLWVGFAGAHAAAGNLARAESLLVQAAGSFPRDADVLYALAEVRERRGRTKEAVDTVRQLLRLHPEHGAGKRLLASLDREQRVEGAYWAEQSTHFVVRYEGVGALDVGRSVVDALEEAHDSIGRDLGVYPPDRLQVGIYRSQVFGEVIGAPPHYIAGAYDGKKIRLNLSASQAYSNDLTRLVRHEYTHAVIHVATKGRAPIWLHEGLAQVMEPRSAPRLIEVSVPRELLTLRGIERLGRTADPLALVAGYQLMHVAVEHLADRGGMAAMRDFLARLGRGEPIPAALRGSFGFGPEEVETRLLAAGGKS